MTDSACVPPRADLVPPCPDEAEALPRLPARVPAGWRPGVAGNGAADGSADLAPGPGVPVSVSDTGMVRRPRPTGPGRPVRDLPALRDVDAPYDAAEVAASARRTRFAALQAELSAAVR
ncbi:hypothetical protein [Streptomyces sp. NPDC051109]|uniref:hypothetical protein n=1 Tax=Streptomyces sp. NPDC051109 TaxID=3365642 RepID=UPI00378C4C06